jgi:hypothetical protein
MSDTPQEAYDCISTRTMKVGGADARLTMARIFLALKECFQRGGPDTVITVTIAAHVPQRRLNP